MFLLIVLLDQLSAFVGTTPEVHLMSGVGLLALVANLGCLFLLTRHRDDTQYGIRLVMLSNDIIANTAVLAALD